MDRAGNRYMGWEDIMGGEVIYKRPQPLVYNQNLRSNMDI
jgi:hypothetical protein